MAFYELKDFLPAWDEMIKAATLCAKSDGFQYDLVDVTMQQQENTCLLHFYPDIKRF